MGKRRERRKPNTNPRRGLLRAAIVLGLLLCLAAALHWRQELAEALREQELLQAQAEDSTFSIRFFDVGEGDAAIVLCDGHAMLIDGGGPDASRFLYAWLEQHGVSHLDSIVCTHAHADHVGGLSGALNLATVDTAYAPVTEYDSRSFSSFVRYLAAQGKELAVPSPGDSFMLGSAEVTFLGPVDPSLALENHNNASIVLRIVYGKTSFLFTGDAEREEELSLLDSGRYLRSTVLKVGHHGSYTSTTEDFLDAVSPDYAVIPVGVDNEYGHPHDSVLDRLDDFGCTLFRTDLDGEILCVSDGREVTFSTEKRP